MANQFSNIAQIMGNRGVQQGAPVPTDPRQQTMMQQLGITNPLLQQFGQQIGNLAGVDTRSATQQLNSSLGEIKGSDENALEHQLTVLANSPAASPEQRIQAVAKLQEIRQAKKDKQNAMTQQEAFSKFITGRYPDLADLASKGVVTPQNYKDFVAAGGKDSKIGFLVSKDSGQTVGNVVIGDGGKVYKDGKPLSLQEIENQGLIVSSSFEKQGSPSANKIGSFVNMVNESTGKRLDVKYDEQGNPFDRSGAPLTATDLEGFVEIKLGAPRNVSADKSVTDFNYSLSSSLKDTDYEYGSTISSGQQLIQIANSTPPTGAGGEFVQAIASGISSLARFTGQEVPEEISKVLETGATLNMAQIEMLKPFIAEQGRGFTDADRKNVERAIASVKSTPELLRLIGTMQIIAGYDNKEKIEMSSYFEGLDERSRVNPKAAWADYKYRLPRVVQMTDDQGRPLPVKPLMDEQRLFKYWEEGSPKSFDMRTADGSIVTRDWKAIEAEAKSKGVATRAYMVILDRTGNIIKANY